MKKIAVISFETVFGKVVKGGGAEVGRRAVALKNAGFDVKIFSFSRDKTLTTRPNMEKTYPTRLSIKNLVSIIPIAVSIRQSKEMIRDVKIFNPDIIVIEGFQSAYILNELKNYKSFLRVHNIESRYHKELSKSAKGIKKLYHYVSYLQYKLWQNYIAKLSIDFVHISDKEREVFKKLKNKNITIFPIAKPMQYDYHITDPIENIVIFGDFGVPSNSFSARWFIDNIFNSLEILQGTKLHLIGISSDKFSGKNIVTYGYVDSLSDLISTLKPLIIHPICYGGGIKIKSIDTLISGMPTIYSHKSLEGLSFLDNQEIFMYEEFSALSFENTFKRFKESKNTKDLTENLKNICQTYLSEQTYINYVKERLGE